MTSLILGILLLSIIIVWYGKNRHQKGYWEGRLKGWQACENMAIERAKEHSYNMDKFMSDILQ